MTHQRISHSYFVVMCDRRSGLEAIVQPEITRNEVIARIKSGEYQNIEFIHFVDGLFVEDLTLELTKEAELDASADRTRSAATAWAFDHARDFRKHEQAAE